MSPDLEMNRDDRSYRAKAGHYGAVRRVLWWVLVANLFVTIIKITLGVVVGALAVVADGFHSLVDSSSNLIGLAAIRLADRPADEKHPYGYRRYESLGALAIGGLLLVAAWEIVSAIFERLGEGASPQITPLVLGIILLTFPVNVAVVILETRAGNKLKSEILLADAKHTRTDLYITGSVLISLVAVSMGLEWVDLVVAGIVVGLIVRAGYRIISDTAGWLTDVVVVDAELVEEIAFSAPAVQGVHRVRSRGTADAAFVDLHVKVDPGMSTARAHAIASEIERRLVDELDNVVDALVHIEPAKNLRPTQWENMARDLREIADGIGIGMHDLHIHAKQNGDYVVEVHLEIGGEMSLGEAHQLADEFESKGQTRWPQANEIITHLEPVPEKVLLRGRYSDPAHEEKVRKVLSQRLPSQQIIDLQLFQSGEHLHTAVTVCMPADTSLTEVHVITENIETDLLKQIPEISRVTLHVEPQEIQE